MKLLGWISLTLVAALLYAPPIQLFVLTFTQNPDELTIESFTASVGESKFTGALTNSLAVATPAALLATLLSFGSLYCASRFAPRWRSTTFALLVLPFFASPTITALTFASASYAWFGIRGSLSLALPALTAAVLPLAAVVALVQIICFDHAQEKLATTLGASPIEVARRITLPALRGSLIGSVLISFLMALNNTETALYAAGSDPTLATLLWGKLRNGFDPGIFHLSSLMTATFLGVAAIAGIALARR